MLDTLMVAGAALILALFCGAFVLPRHPGGERYEARARSSAVAP